MRRPRIRTCCSVLAAGVLLIILLIAGTFAWVNQRPHVIVKGKVTDTRGRPVADAQITGVQEISTDPEIGDPETPISPHTVSTVTRSDGTYVLKGLIRPKIDRTFGYLNGGDPTRQFHSFYLSVQVDASGYAQGHARLPLVTKELLAQARTMHRVLYRWERLFRKGQPYDIERERKGLGPFPASKGNTITGVDVMLRPSKGK